MVQAISGSRRNITTDNWFTSVPLADELLTTHKLTLVGTLRKNKREVPSLFLQSRSMENSSVFGFTKDTTLLSSCPKKKKVVLLLSTVHHTDEIDPDSEESRKPYLLTFYNSTKGGVDMVDEYKARYSVARTSNRWPLTLFFTLLNIAGINSFIILKHNIRQFDMFRRKFLQTLSKELSRNYLLERLQLENLLRQLKRNIREITGTAEERYPPPSGEDEGPGRCHLCDWKKNPPEISRELLNIWRDLDLSEGEDFDSDDSLRDPTFTLSKETDKSSADINSDTMVGPQKLKKTKNIPVPYTNHVQSDVVDIEDGRTTTYESPIKEIILPEITNQSFPRDNIANCNAETLLNLITQWILPGTTIVYDCWKAYNVLQNEGFVHLRVNHSGEFVDTDASGEIHMENVSRLAGQILPVHTQNIERKWLSIKYSMHVFGRRKEHFEGYFAEHILKSKFPRSRLLCEFFKRAALLYPPQP
ncbi:hypothetical protein ANN_26663 [Periplaneta americana]|uniref:Transposase n=1 Tax=Periplaneta americana TaxID=6978 RepID=A0ABQ8RYR1_PERAM|nr:hypothetical protein ANN_26663 [Periplaneta americana]